MRYHSRWVRLSHAIRATSLLALLASGGMILLAYPRLHLGEFGSHHDNGLTLPLPLVTGFLPRGRTLHFLTGWVLVINGLATLLASLVSGRLQRVLLRSRTNGGPYSGMQRLAYAGLSLVVMPLLLLSGLAMSPSVVADYPGLLVIFSGRHSARSVHFTLAVLVLLFTVGHVMLALRSRGRLPGMIRRRPLFGGAQ